MLVCSYWGAWVGGGESQDTFDHDNWDRNLQFRGAVSTGFFFFLNFLQWIFPLFSRFNVQFRKEMAPKCGENLPDFRVEKTAKNPVTSLPVIWFFFRSREKGARARGAKEENGVQGELPKVRACYCCSPPLTNF